MLLNDPSLLDKTTPRNASGAVHIQFNEPSRVTLDHLQVIDDSLNSEPATEQSVTRSRNNEWDPSFYKKQQQQQHSKNNGGGISETNSLEHSLAGISEIQAPAMMLQECGGGWDS